MKSSVYFIDLRASAAPLKTWGWDALPGRVNSRNTPLFRQK
jgi:hypothetical protein